MRSNKSPSDTGGGSAGAIEFELDGVATPVSEDTGTPGDSVPLPVKVLDDSGLNIDVRLGALNEAAPASDTASSGLNGRLQRIAQRLTSLIALLPTSLGQKTSANSLAVVPASDYVPAHPAVPTALTVKQATVTVGTSAVRMTHDGNAPSATRRRLQVQPDAASSAKFFYGSATVTADATATGGIEIVPGQILPFENDANDYYIISDTLGQSVRIVEVE